MKFGRGDTSGRRTNGEQIQLTNAALHATNGEITISV